MQNQQTGTGVYSTSVQQVEPSFGAARTTLRPPEIGVGGAFKVALTSGIMAAGLAAASPIFAFRWTDTGMNCWVRRVRITGGTDATAFAQGSAVFDVVRASVFAAQYTGGQTVTLTGKSQQMASRMAPTRQQIAATAVGNIAVANTAALAAGAPAPTLDNNALGVLIGSVGAAPATILVPQPGLLIDPTDPAGWPLELAANEGFVVRATVPGTGTWKFGVEVDYLEFDPQRFYLNP